MNETANGKNRILIAIAVIIAVAALIGTVTYAWLAGNNRVDCTLVKGSVLKQYFHCGDGSEDDPFVITRPAHFYNLVYLYQRLEGFADEGYHFQLGYDLDGDSSTFEFFNYDSDGMMQGGYTDTLNMAYYQDGLLPIGTSDVPFDGIFDGKGLSIENLKVISKDEYGGTSDVGIFGYVNETAEVRDVYFKNVTIDLTNSDPAKTTTVAANHNAILHDLNGDEAPDTVYVGYIAGHICLGAQVTNVYINDSKIVGGHSARSDYGYFGCVEEPGEGKVASLGSLVATLRTKGSDAGFGGSIDMKNMYNRVSAIRTLARNNANFRYDANKTVTIDKVTGKTTYSYPSPATGTLQNNYIGYSVNGGGTYIYYNRTGYDQFNYMSSTSSTQTTSVATYTYVANSEGTDYKYDDAFIVSDGANYLDATDAAVISTANTQANAQPFVWEGSYIYTRIDGIKYYLNANGTTGVTLSTTKNTTWTKSANNELYTVIGGTNFYLDYDNGWILNPVPYRLGDGTHFISANNTNNGVVNATEDAARKWILSNPAGNTTIGYRVGNTYYYLGYNNNGALTVSTTQTTWNKDGNAYYVTIANERFYLAYDNGWKLVLTNGYKLHDGNSHYLSATTTAVQNAAEGAAVEWILSNPTGATTQISTIINGTKYYLRYENGLTMGTTAFTWNKTGNAYYYTTGGNDYYITYDNGWTAIRLAYQTISDGNGNYLRVTGANTFANTTNEAEATHFHFSSTNGNPSGTVYAVVNGTTYYLYNNNGTLNTTTAVGTATSWTNDGSSLVYTNNGITYAIRYNGTWNIQTINNGTVITDGNGNYLRITGTGTSSYTNTRDLTLATRFIFSNGNAGTISTNYNGQTVYLRWRTNQNTPFQLTTNSGNATNVTNDNNNLVYNGYYLVYRNVWTVSQTGNDTSTKYKIAYNGNYMAYTMNNGEPILTNATNANAENVILWNENSGNISTTINGTTYYLTSTTTDGALLALSETRNTATWTTHNTNYRYFSAKTGGIWGIGGTTYRYWIKYDNGWKNVRTNDSNNQYTNASQLTFTNTSVTTTYYSRTQVLNDATPTITVAKKNISTPQITRIDGNRNSVDINKTAVQEDFLLNFADSRLQVIEKVVTTEKTGTYFPLRTGADDDGGAANNYTASPKNTGYIISGRYETTSDYHSDIRISEYAKSNISGSYSTSNRTFTTIYTFDANGNHELTDAQKTPVFEEASKQLLETLNGASNVYGLHFMNAEISTDRLIVAKQATILGTTYENYQLPEDSIDFNVIERGTISFFAGEYFSGNNAFFSLHQIFRDENNDITDIKEISEVYKHKTEDRTNYIYKYTDNTYTNADGTYTGATIRDKDYNSTPVFQTSWIKNPSGLDTRNKHLYFFEIPCNAGEYALGSVSGKTGAYLVYLDIAANGGDAIAAVVDENENNPAKEFMVEFRDNPDQVGEGCVTRTTNGKSQPINNTVLLYSLKVPENATSSNFSIDITFSDDDSDIDTNAYPYGLYTIKLKNTTGNDAELFVLLVENDGDMMTPFGFAYELEYTNSSGTQTFKHFDLDYWKSAAGFIIPSTGDAHEMTADQYSDYTS